MLVLSRKDGEENLIGDEILIKVFSVQKNQVKIAIQAPKDVAIRRAELKDHADFSSRQGSSDELV